MQINRINKGFWSCSGLLAMGALLCVLMLPALVLAESVRVAANDALPQQKTQEAPPKTAIGLTSVKLANSTILVSTSLSLDTKSLDEIKRGVGKELVFYIDLFRVWNNWPDEFVLGISVAHSLRCDPLKREYTLATTRGNASRQMRFSSCEELLSTCLSLSGELLTSTGALPEATYYVKATAESRLRELPPFVDLLFFFVKESEFLVEARSESFAITNTSAIK